jgi:hypothetical protein
MSARGHVENLISIYRETGIKKDLKIWGLSTWIGSVWLKNAVLKFMGP